MKNFCWIALLVLCACGGSISSEDRKKMHEAMKTQKIQRVTQGEIADAALKKGNEILRAAAQKRNKLDSVARANQVTIKWLTPGTNNAALIESQLIEAYITGGSQENVQFVGADSVLYTKPEVETQPDGAVNVKGMWSIWLSKKQIVLSLDKD